MSHNNKLKNAPLKEVILEINWEENVDEFGNKFDLGFELAQGKFSEIIKPHFPIHKKLYNSNQQPIYGIPIHQYWTDELEWPVIQHGQGILTINQTEEKYTWTDFKKLILMTINFLKNSYENNITINRISLEYLDAFDMNDFNSSSFIENNLQTSIKTKYDLPGKLSNIKINRNYIQKDGTHLNINISDAVNNSTNKDAVIMLTSAIKENADVNQDFENNLEDLHNLCSKVFKTILDKNYYGSLN
jgi:uncharacterized protein (TIGR04255 family)